MDSDTVTCSEDWISRVAIKKPALDEGAQDTDSAADGAGDVSPVDFGLQVLSKTFGTKETEIGLLLFSPSWR